MRRMGRLVPLPPHGRGQRVGLYGGSFNPPHAGHAHVVHAALKRLDLDRIWVLVTPGNPLKDPRQLAALPERMAALSALIDDPRVTVTDLEARAGLRYSRDTVHYLCTRAPDVRFVWIMGADNLATFHRWQDWERIADSMPIAVVDRPGSSTAPLSSPAGRAMERFRLPERAAPSLAAHAPPAWVFLHGRQMPHSSSALRGARPTGE